MMRHGVADSATREPELSDLRALALVADLGSLTAAAKSARETKGTLSRRMARLERAVGATLLRRGPRGVVLTEEGLAFRARVGSALEQLDAALLALQSARDEPRGTLRFTAPVDMAALLAPVVARYVELHPAVRVEALLTQERVDFDLERIDVALRAAPSLPDSPLVGRKILDLELTLAAAPSYLSRRSAPRDPGELAAHTVLGMRFGQRGTTFTFRSASSGKSQPVDLDPAISSTDTMFVRELALAGAGIAAVPSVVVARDLASGELVRVLPDYSALERGALFLLHAQTPFLPSRTRAFRDLTTRLLGPAGAPPAGPTTPSQAVARR